MIRARIAAAGAAVALAAAGLVAGTTVTAQATTPPTPYMCPYFLNDGASGLYTWTYGQGWLVCNYSPHAELQCRYNAFSGDAWYNAPNPAYCPTRAIPTA
ncbi:hypothetical protein SAMN05216251_12920 [Actinacidiphila alni]|uniref:Secreted protein n=1 Tax=Actinacidiphila alni TaxID=380248 RepID=A0A1I2LNK9_9ACTN|nr:hypothetical protein [Actinacidiphila alni]SFF79007.1 hypothetical protein SAMN05216251_12920 [Actinacidiphila alni]